MTKHIANILTSCRILGSVLLLFFPVFSLAFYILHLFCGFSDMIDGTGVAQDMEQAAFWYRQAALQDHDLAIEPSNCRPARWSF